MGRKAKYSKELKLEIVRRYMNGESPSYLANEYGLPKCYDGCIRKWTKRFIAFGEKAFNETNQNKKYSKKLKLKVINEYLNGEGSFDDLAIKYKVSTPHIVRGWVLKYNNGIEIKNYKPESEVYTMKARKTTFEERLQIVKYVITNDYDYKTAASKFTVPYASVYQWVKKYSESGEDGLLDRRGRHENKISNKELTIEKKQAIEIEKLKRELELEKKRNEVLKKNIEIRERMERDFHLLDKKTSTKQ